jgi:hypothetical protein
VSPTCQDLTAAGSTGRVNEIANSTLTDVRTAMATRYHDGDADDRRRLPSVPQIDFADALKHNGCDGNSRGG